MAYQQRDNSGSLWVNDKKTEDKHPDRTGSLMVNGEEYFIDGWLKETSTGKRFLSLSVKRKNKQGGQSAPQQQQQRPPVSKPRPPSSAPVEKDPEFGDEASDIPF
jgi:hypothetical protein